MTRGRTPVVLRSGVRRKHMAGLRPVESAAAPFEAGIYQPDSTRRTYAALLADTAGALRRGRPVVVDAAFPTQEQRSPFARLAATLGTPFVVAHVAVPHQVAAARLRSRQERPDVSDADLRVYQAMRRRFEPPTEFPLSQRVTLDGREPGGRPRPPSSTCWSRPGVAARRPLNGCWPAR